jgi:hypothetical protein
MDMSDTISNNSALLKENKRLDMSHDDTSINSNSLIQTPLIQNDVKTTQNIYNDQDDWTYVEKKQNKNDNQ